MSGVPVLAFAGSARRDSLNKKLVRIAADCAREAGGAVTLIDLQDYPMPIYHGDYEAEHGLPDSATRLRELFLAHDGLIIASPAMFGGARGLPHLRRILASLGVTVLGAQVSIPRADHAFDASGALVEEGQRKVVATLARAVVESAAKLREAPDPPRIMQDH